MNSNFTVGFVTTLSGRWPRELPEKRKSEYGKWLEDSLAGMPNLRLVQTEYLVDSPAAALKAAEELHAQGVELLVMVYGAFTGDDVPTLLARELDVPVLLWAPREVPFERNTRLYANALCSATMNGASLHRLECPYHIIYGNKEEAKASAKVLGLIEGYSVKKRMSRTLLGLYGYRPTAFYNCAFDEGLIRRVFGVRMEETDLKVVFDAMAALPQQQVEDEMKAVESRWSAAKLPEGHLENHARLYLALKQITEQQGYDFAAIKCWPEMGNLHTTPCAVMGRLADDGIHIGCEGDVDAQLAQIAQNYLTGLPTFITDMINMDEQQNTLTFWHCGNAAPSLHNPKYEVTLENHPLAGQGSAFWAALKPGAVTIARFCNLRGSYKLFLLSGEALDSDRYTRGAMVNVRMNTPVEEILQSIGENGIPHHYSVVWQDVADKLEILAGLLGVEVIRL